MTGNKPRKVIIRSLASGEGKKDQGREFSKKDGRRHYVKKSPAKKRSVFSADTGRSKKRVNRTTPRGSRKRHLRGSPRTKSKESRKKGEEKRKKVKGEGGKKSVL